MNQNLSSIVLPIIKMNMLQLKRLIIQIRLMSLYLGGSYYDK